MAWTATVWLEADAFWIGLARVALAEALTDLVALIDTGLACWERDLVAFAVAFTVTLAVVLAATFEAIYVGLL